MLPEIGQSIRVRTPTCLVEPVEHDPLDERLSTVRGACLDDAPRGERIRVVRALEPDAQILDGEASHRLGAKGSDDPRWFRVFLVEGSRRPEPIRFGAIST